MKMSVSLFSIFLDHLEENLEKRDRFQMFWNCWVKHCFGSLATETWASLELSGINFGIFFPDPDFFLFICSLISVLGQKILEKNNPIEATDSVRFNCFVLKLV